MCECDGHRPVHSLLSEGNMSVLYATYSCVTPNLPLAGPVAAFHPPDRCWSHIPVYVYVIFDFTPSLTALLIRTGLNELQSFISNCKLPHTLLWKKTWWSCRLNVGENYGWHPKCCCWGKWTVIVEEDNGTDWYMKIMFWACNTTHIMTVMADDLSTFVLQSVNVSLQKSNSDKPMSSKWKTQGASPVNLRGWGLTL